MLIKDYWTVKEVADYLSVSKGAVYKNPDLIKHHFGGSVRIAEKNLKEYEKACQRITTKPAT